MSILKMKFWDILIQPLIKLLIFFILIYQIWIKKIIKIIQGFSKEIIIFLNKVLSLYNQIIKIIQQNFIILENFLQNFDFFEKNPFQNYFKQEFDNITTNWLFLKLDLDKFDFKNSIEVSNLNKNYKDLLTNECYRKNFEMNIILPEIKQNSAKNLNTKKEKYKGKIKLFSNNSNHLLKLNLENVQAIDDFIGKKSLIHYKN